MVNRDDEFAAQRLPETAARGGGCPTPARWRFCNRLLVTPDALSMCCDRLARCGTGDFHLGSASTACRGGFRLSTALGMTWIGAVGAQGRLRGRRRRRDGNTGGGGLLPRLLR